jgi:hypothetical protein
VSATTCVFFDVNVQSVQTFHEHVEINNDYSFN